MTKQMQIRDNTFLILNSTKLKTESWSDYLERLYKTAHNIPDDEPWTPEYIEKLKETYRKINLMRQQNETKNIYNNLLE